MEQHRRFITLLITFITVSLKINFYKGIFYGLKQWFILGDSHCIPITRILVSKKTNTLRSCLILSCLICSLDIYVCMSRKNIKPSKSFWENGTRCCLYSIQKDENFCWQNIIKKKLKIMFSMKECKGKDAEKTFFFICKGY